MLSICSISRMVKHCISSAISVHNLSVCRAMPVTLYVPFTPIAPTDTGWTWLHYSLCILQISTAKGGS